MLTVRHLGIGDVVLIAAELLELPPEVMHRRMRLDVVQRALMATAADLEDEPLYETLELQAAVLTSRLARGRPLADGSSRLAWLCLREFVRRNGHDLQPDDPDDAVAMLESLAAGLIADSEFAVWLSGRLASLAAGGKSR
jgi:prophage maintenance system killer protein